MTAVQDRPVAPAGGTPQPSSPSTNTASARTDSADALATVALTAMTVIAVLSAGRLFDGNSFLGPVLLSALAAHFVAWACRRLDVGPVLLFFAPFVTILILVAWVVFPASTVFGIPTARTFHLVGHNLSAAFNDFRTVVAPTKVTDGFVVLLTIGAAMIGFLADWAAFRMRALFESVLPSFGLFVFTCALGAPRWRWPSVAGELIAVLAFLIVHEATVSDQGWSWFASRRRGALGSVAGPGIVIGGVAVVVALIVGINLPGASVRNSLPWNTSGDHNATRSTVSPLVDIRGRLADHPGIPVFSVRSTLRTYWRLTSLDKFDGDIWSSNNTYRPVRQRLPVGITSSAQGQIVNQTFLVSGLASIWLPAAYQPSRIDGIKGVSYDSESGSLISEKDTTNGLSYQVQSAIPEYGLTASQLNGVLPAAGAALSRYLELPTIPSSVADLARSIVKGKDTPYSKALALQDFFRGPNSHFIYDQNFTQGHSNNALVTFLFRTHKGYCEQFAGAYAVMARAVGLPTRVAVGFTPGEDVGDGLYEVKDANAHAWPEIYFTGIGWVPFEPTPGRAVPGASAYTGLKDSADNSQGAGSTTPNSTPATTTPPDATVTVSTTTPAPRKPLATKHHHGTSPFLIVLAWLAAAVALAGIYALGVPALTRRRRWHRRHAAAEDPDRRVLVAWDEAGTALARSGLGRRPSETYDEFGRRVAPDPRLQGAPGSGVRALAGASTAAVFAPGRITHETASAAEATADAVEGALLTAATPRQRMLWKLDPRPLFSRQQ
jgi:transglutaminase-like putative cysteine protease